jgi:putative phosphoesterase
MRIAFISDIHGNIDALKQVLSFIEKQGADKLLFLGDAVGYLPYGVEVLAALGVAGAQCLMGNHEAMMLGLLPVEGRNNEVYKLDEQDRRFNDSQRQKLASWPRVSEMSAGKLNILCVHGSPAEPLAGYVYPDSDLDAWTELPYDIIVMGHTHYPFARNHGNKLFINPGSVGLPRDQGDLSSLAILDVEEMKVMHYRIRFDVNKVLSDLDAGAIHQKTRECLTRVAARPIFGQLV